MAVMYGRHGKPLVRKRDYPIIRFLIGCFYGLAVILLGGGLVTAGYLWFRAEAIRDGYIIGGPLADALNPYSASDLCLGAAACAGSGLLAFLMLGAFGQLLAMQRDRSISSALSVQLLEDILEANEQAGTAIKGKRVELCEGCGRLGSLHRIDSGQWVCRECRRQLRTA